MTDRRGRPLSYFEDWQRRERRKARAYRLLGLALELASAVVAILVVIWFALRVRGMV